MANLYSVGVNRLSYKAANFATGKTVTAYLWSPTLVKSALQTFTEIEGGLYYLDYNFTAEGSYMGLFYENGVPTVSGTFRVSALALEATLTAIKGAGWTTETLKAIKEAISAISTLTGTRQITITIYKQATTTPIPDYQISIYNSGATLLLGLVKTNANGQVAFNIDDGTYKLRGFKMGYSAVNVTETLVVTADASVTYYAAEIAIGTPADVNACRVYEWCFMPDDMTPMASIVAMAKILSLPYDYDGKLHSGQEIAGTYSNTTGKVYWDVVHGATVEFSIENILKKAIKKTIPTASSARLILIP